MEIRTGKREGAIAVVCKRINDQVKFLILKRKEKEKGWELIKGGKETSENIEETIKRELKEEAGIKFSKIWVLKEKIQFTYPRKFWFLGKKCVLTICVVLTNQNKFTLEKIFSQAKWARIEEAFEKLKWMEQRLALKMGAEFFLKLCKFSTKKFMIPYWLREMFTTGRLKKDYKPSEAGLIFYRGKIRTIKLDGNIRNKEFFRPLEPLELDVSNIKIFILFPGKMLWKRKG